MLRDLLSRLEAGEYFDKEMCFGGKGTRLNCLWGYGYIPQAL